MIKIYTTPEKWELSKKLAGSSDPYNNNSIRNGGGNNLGKYAEIDAMTELKMIYKVMPKISTKTNKYDYDFTMQFPCGVKKIDVKAKEQNCSGDIITPNWSCCVYETSFHQQCDMYIFTRVIMDNNKTMPIYSINVGMIDKTEFFKISEYVKAGKSASFDTRHKMEKSARICQIKDLYPLDYFLK